MTRDTFYKYYNSLPSDRIGISSFEVFQEIDSTSKECLRRLQKAQRLHNPDGTLTQEGKSFNTMTVCALTQTGGHGRLGRNFYSPKGTGVYWSFICVPEFYVQNPTVYTISSVVGLCRAIEKLYKKNPLIKWVNDIYLDNKKISGILTEGFINPQSQKIEAVVVGIGVNLKTDSNMPSNLKDKVGGIFKDCDTIQPDFSQFLAECMYEVSKIISIKEDVYNDYQNRFMLTGKTVTVSPLIADKSKDYTAQVLGLSKDYGLIVKLADGTQKVLHTGEVTLHYN